ncbi:DegV family protein [Paenibacillus protaetiae]|uniref:DegV family protein n=1 Tax=Paenibacillus protaetiae TaxID=2509456 RepID=A0A4P6ESJ1_9BACL|nr:DegV family protein [Paenibacillus protaetiae]QAY65536.1 DegV family protein [Paenibacillus protaetiae]
MGKIIIMTDSTSDIPQEVRERLQIEMIPLKIEIDGVTYLDNVTLDPDSFYEKLAAASALPKTSQPSPTEFVEAFQRILQQEPDASIISFHLSSEFSGTYQSALIAYSMLEEQADITIIDSKSASYGFGARVVKAAEMALEGESKEAILEEVSRLEKETEVFFLVDTLEYLQKGGRIGRASAIIGTLLNIKPILSIDKDGFVTSVDKVRGTKKAMNRIIELLHQKFDPQEPVAIIMAWAGRKDAAMDLHELVKNSFNVQKTDFTTIGPVIGNHAGPGTSAVFMYKLKG